MRQLTPRIYLWCCLLMILSGLPGCFIMQIGVANPAPNLPRIAIAPFVNLSPERSVDGRRFAEAYYTELQKVPGFQVIPVGVVESAMHDHQLNLDTPRDMEKLIEILDADGVCFGAITEYNSYYPPRLGLQISWYTTRQPDFQPGLPLDPAARKQYLKSHKMPSGESHKNSSWSEKLRCSIPGWSCSALEHSREISAEELLVRAQNDDSSRPVPQLTLEEQQQWEQQLLQVMGLTVSPTVAPHQQADNLPVQATTQPQLVPPETVEAPAPYATNPLTDPQTVPQTRQLPSGSEPALRGFPIGPGLEQPFAVTAPTLPGENPFPGSPFPQPYMSYTRVFDGADSGFTASLKNYLELSGDQRSGGWTGYLHRSEDFIRFCMHRMIVEMMQLHGGEAERRFVISSRKY